MGTLIRHVLVVDDDADSRMLLSALLTVMGYSVTSAASGDERLRYVYSEKQCDAVVADVMMPGMSGVEFARLIRKVRPQIPVALVTGQPNGIDVAIRAGRFRCSSRLLRSRSRHSGPTPRNGAR